MINKSRKLEKQKQISLITLKIIKVNKLHWKRTCKLTVVV